MTDHPRYIQCPGCYLLVDVDNPAIPISQAHLDAVHAAYRVRKLEPNSKPKPILVPEDV